MMKYKFEMPNSKQILLILAGMLISSFNSSIERAKSEEATRMMIQEIVQDELKKLNSNK